MGNSKTIPQRPYLFEENAENLDSSYKTLNTSSHIHQKPKPYIRKRKVIPIIDPTELSQTLNFLKMNTFEQQKLLINDILSKPIQLKINKRASKYMPHIFSSEYERFFIRNFVFSNKNIKNLEKNTNFLPENTKDSLFNVFNKEILDKFTIKNKEPPVISKKKRVLSLKLDKSADLTNLSEKSLKNSEKPQKTYKKNNEKIGKNVKDLNNMKKPPNFQKKTRSISTKSPSDSTSYIKISLVSLIEKEKKQKAESFLKAKTKKKLSISSSVSQNNQYYNKFSYLERKKSLGKFKKPLKNSDKSHFNDETSLADEVQRQNYQKNEYSLNYADFSDSD